jgi:uncharacterized protein YdeI (YjbR/CyaY-like superfamily)
MIGGLDMSQYDSDIPLGLGMHLAQNPAAMRYFTSLNSVEQRDIIEHTHSIDSPAEMRRYVQTLASLGSEVF